jgi:hypothetical protein
MVKMGKDLQKNKIIIGYLLSIYEINQWLKKLIRFASLFFIIVFVIGVGLCFYKL